jgi:hypothetical protein
MLTTSGWLDSLIAGRPVNGSGVPIPWMNYSAIDFIGSKIKSSHRVFEWGAGFSSLWFASKVKEVISAEDNLEWYEEINKKTPPNLHIIKATTKQYYIDSITNQPDNFDIVVIDGSHRNQCANVCIKKLNQDGFIIFDNSDSKEYDESMHYFDKNGFFRIDFWGLIPSYFYKNCTSIIFRDPGFLRYSTPPSCQVLSSGISCFQAYDKGAGESELGKP